MAHVTFQSDPIFIGGDGRSGTTVLSLILDSHPHLAVGPELHFNGPDNLGPYVLECCDLLIAGDPRTRGAGLKETPHLKRGVQFAKRCHRYGVSFEDLRALILDQMSAVGGELKSFEDRCALINAVGEHRCAATGAHRWGIKVMREIARADGYAKVWPRAQFIHIIRDGRDVASSQLIDHSKWGYEDIRLAARGWVDLIEKVRACARRLQVMEVRYEDLALEPEPTIRRIVDFLGVPFCEDMLHHSEQEHTLYDNPYNHPSIKTAVRPLNADAVGRHKRDLDPQQRKGFDRIAGKYLVELGYDMD